MRKSEKILTPIALADRVFRLLYATHNS